MSDISKQFHYFSVSCFKEKTAKNGPFPCSTHTHKHTHTRVQYKGKGKGKGKVGSVLD